jgi:hypothetical protein
VHIAEDVLAILSRITTVFEMMQAFCDEDHCRRRLCQGKLPKVA